jgi:hypothetical protein
MHNITASGNISASGDLTANNATINEGFVTVDGAGTSHGFQLKRDSSDTYKIRHLDGGLTIQNSTDNRKEMTFDGAGNVGIGNASPGEKLEVVGNISASGNVWSENQYTFETTAKGDTDNDDNWQGPNSYGIHTRADWNYDYGTDYDDITATNDENRSLINTGWRIPNGANYSASIISMDIYVTANSNITYANDDNFSCSLWYSKASDLITETNQVNTSAGNFTQRHASTAISTQFKASDEKLFKYNLYHVSSSIGLNLAPGAMLFPRIKTVGTNDFNTVFHWVINYKKTKL